MNKFIVFGYDVYYPYGGEKDIQGLCETLEQAEKLYDKIYHNFTDITIFSIDENKVIISKMGLDK